MVVVKFSESGRAACVPEASGAYGFLPCLDLV